MEEPLDGLAVGFVAQFSGELENPSGAGGWHSNSATATVDFGVAVLGGSLGGGEGGGELLLGVLGGIVRSGGDG